MEQKQRLRRELRLALGSMSAEQRRDNSLAIASALQRLPQLLQARSVFVYVAREPEVDTAQLLQWLLASGRAVSVPLIVDAAAAGSAMHAARISSMHELRPGRYGIMAPAADASLCRNPDVAIVPGLAFDRSGRRLGQGVGCYDGWFAANPRSFRIALAHGVQLLAGVPAEPHDVDMDMVVSEHGVVRC